MERNGSFDLRRHLPSTAFVLVVLLFIAGFAGVFIYTGAYNIGADAPHSKLVYSLLQELRDNAVASHAKNIPIPQELTDPKRAEAGAGLYQEMCSGCHVGPGSEPSELSQGLYPPAPDLAHSERSPAEQFWTIKHGVKLTAMPAWGKTHSDELIWDIVAFIRQLPKMSPQQYRAAIASAPEHHQEMMEMHPKGKGMEAHDTVSPHAHEHPGEKRQR